MIICKRPTTPDDHLQGACQSRWSFARGRPLQMIICKFPAPPDDHLQQQQQKLKGRKLHQIQNISIFPPFH